MKSNNTQKENRAAERRRTAKTTKIGMYTFAVSAIVLAVIIVINLLVGLIPAKFTSFDTSTNKLYTISGETESYLASVNEDITINWICQGGEQEATLGKFLENYVANSSHLKLNILDPVKDPTILDKYITETDTQPSNYSLILESARRYKIVDFVELFYFYNSLLEETYGIGAVPYEVYQSSAYYQVFYYAESSGYTTEQLFYGEDTITKAVEYVTLENIPHIYILEGHGEDAFSAMFLDFISTNNIVYETLRLDTAGTVPADANCVVIYSPTTDLSDSDTALLRSYLKDGGNMMLITSNDNIEHKNLLSLMSDYGLSAEAGIVYEGSASNYKDSPYYVRPTANTSHQATAYASGYTMYMPQAHGITISNDATGITQLFTTSSSAYTMSGEQKSEAGARTLGAAVTATGTNGTTQIVWYSSAQAFTDDVAATASYGNYYYMFYSLFWMNETYESQLSTVEGPSLSEPILDGLTASSIYIWTGVFAILIPGIVLISGLVVWIRRRKR